MEQRQSLLDWAMNKQTKPTKTYASIQERLFCIPAERKGDRNVSARHIDKNKEVRNNG